MIEQQGMLGEVAVPIQLAAIILFPVLATLVNSFLEFSKAKASPGKLLLGLRVIDANTNEAIGMTQAVVRNMLKLFSVFLLATFNGNDFLHDRCSHTRVIKKEE